MSKQKTKSLREEIHDLIIKAMEQGIGFTNLLKMIKEEKDKIDQEKLEQGIERSKKEKEFRNKGLKMFHSLKATYSETVSYMMCSRIFRNKRQMNNCLEILCVFYKKETQNIHEVLHELEERLQIKEEAILSSMAILFSYIAHYYGYESFQLKRDEELKRKKLQDFICEIQKF